VIEPILWFWSSASVEFLKCSNVTFISVFKEVLIPDITTWVLLAFIIGKSGYAMHCDHIMLNDSSSRLLMATPHFYGRDKIKTPEQTTVLSQIKFNGSWIIVDFWGNIWTMWSSWMFLSLLLDLKWIRQWDKLEIAVRTYTACYWQTAKIINMIFVGACQWDAQCHLWDFLQFSVSNNVGSSRT